MSTSEVMNKSQRKLAEYSYELLVKYNLTEGITKKQYLAFYKQGNIQLSSIFENLYVATRLALGFNTKKRSKDHYDFVEVIGKGKSRPLGDMKTTVLAKNGKRQRRFVIAGVEGKIGTIYAICWNSLTNQPNFFAIPPDKNGTHPKCGYKIMVHPETGLRTGGKYNDNYAFDTWEEMVSAEYTKEQYREVDLKKKDEVVLNN
jgi:hypothetical protein